MSIKEKFRIKTDMLIFGYDTKKGLERSSEMFKLFKRMVPGMPRNELDDLDKKMKQLKEQSDKDFISRKYRNTSNKFNWVTYSAFSFIGPANIRLGILNKDWLCIIIGSILCIQLGYLARRMVKTQKERDDIFIESL